MKAVCLFRIALGIPIAASAASLLIPFQEKVESCEEIALVRVTDITPPRTDSLVEPAVATASVIERFKGEANRKTLTFRFVPYGDYPKGNLQSNKNKEFIVFLHVPKEDKLLWLFDGPRGMRPIQPKYSEWRLDSKNSLVTDVYTKDQYLRMLREISH
jgi:hypothetical protein